MLKRDGRRTKGFGYLEVLITIVIVSLLATIAIPSYSRYADRARNARAIGTIGSLSVEIGKYQLRNNNALPASLNELPMEIPLDPWGREYQYLNIATADPGVGDFRKDKNLNPLNTDFDLYSLGKDGDTAGPLSAASSRDDIVRANNGAFIGRGEDY